MVSTGAVLFDETVYGVPQIEQGKSVETLGMEVSNASMEQGSEIGMFPLD